MKLRIKLFEPGVAERIWDVFKTVHELPTVPKEALEFLKVLGLKIPKQDREPLFRLIGKVAIKSENVLEFESFLISGNVNKKVRMSKVDKCLLLKFQKKGNLVSSASPISNLKLSLWRYINW